MKKKLFILFLYIFSCLSAFSIDIKYSGIDTISLHDHGIYKSFWNRITLNPAVTWYTLTNVQAIESDEVTNRTNDFRNCILGSSDKKDYIKSGYDKGHMCPSGDFDYSKETSSLTFLMCNMCPQKHILNAGEWLKYEKEERSLAKKYGSIQIVCGPIYKSSNYIKNRIKIPDEFFKIFSYNNKVQVYIFTQDNYVRESSLKEIKELTDLDITF